MKPQAIVLDFDSVAEANQFVSRFIELARGYDSAQLIGQNQKDETQVELFNLDNCPSEILSAALAELK